MQRPDEIAAQVGPGGDRRLDRVHVVAQVVDPARIVDGPVGSRLVVEGDPVLGDVDRDGRVLAAEPVEVVSPSGVIAQPMSDVAAPGRARRASQPRPSVVASMTFRK